MAHVEISRFNGLSLGGKTGTGSARSADEAVKTAGVTLQIVITGLQACANDINSVANSEQ